MKMNPTNILFFVMILVSCSNDEVFTPKPRGYFRIELPQKKYSSCDTFPEFSFDVPLYAAIKPADRTTAHTRAFNIVFPSLGATLYMTWFPVLGNIKQLLNDQHEYINKHLPKASDIRENRYSHPNSTTFALTYDIKGNAVATPLQFYITDSTRNFLRGSLYFNQIPNNDSLSPIIEFLKKDVDQLILSLKWKNK